MPHRYLQLDVFAARAGTGNPLGVVFDAGPMDTATMQALAAWLNLSETIFFLPPDPGADYRIRIFTPGSELPFAGHPSVGTAHVVLEAGLAEPRQGLLLQEGVAGLLPLRVDMDAGVRRIAIRTPRAQLVEPAEARGARLAEALDWLPAGALPPALMDGGRRWWLAEARDEASLRSALPDWDSIAALARATASMGVLAFARCHGQDYQVAARAFVGGPALFEDAASGAANATLAAWLALRDALPGSGGHYQVSQGREVGHDARLHMQVDADGEVWSGGQVVSVVRGTIDWG